MTNPNPSQDRVEERWCHYCQCFHKKPYPKAQRCKANEPDYQRETGMIPDMLDYN